MWINQNQNRGEARIENTWAESAGRRPMRGSEHDLCQKQCVRHACPIQDCLAKNMYNMSKCRVQIEKWEQCCDQILADAKQAITGVAVQAASEGAKK